MQLVETRLENDLVLALVIFAMQYILINHEYWKYKVKNVRWKVTLKVFFFLSCFFILIFVFSYYGQTYKKSSKFVQGALFCQFSVSSCLIQQPENLFVNSIVAGFSQPSCEPCSRFFVLKCNIFASQIIGRRDLSHQIDVPTRNKTMEGL